MIWCSKPMICIRTMMVKHPNQWYVFDIVVGEIFCLPINASLETQHSVDDFNVGRMVA
jgi:hypothetical protein